MTAEIAFALWLLLFVCVAGDGARRAYRGVRPRAIRAMPTKTPEWADPRASATAARFASKRSRRWAPPGALMPADPAGGGQSDRALWAQVNAARAALAASTPRVRESAPVPRKPPSGSPVKTVSVRRDW